MSTSPEGAAVFFKTWKSTFVGHLELQSMSYRVGTPCKQISVHCSKKLTNIKSKKNDNFGFRLLFWVKRG